MYVQVSVRKAESAINSRIMWEITEALTVDYEKVIAGTWMSIHVLKVRQMLFPGLQAVVARMVQQNACVCIL